MLFNSLNFVIFFTVLYAAYLLLPHRGQNILLLAGSYFFYAFWDWRFVGLLILSTVVDYVLANMIAASDSPARRKGLLTISMCVSLGVLGFFKYFNFFADNLEALLHTMGWNISAARLQLILPWGISFYTFQTMNYTIDVYRRHMEPTRNLLDFAVFVSFFPHLVAGPIMRATVLLPQVMKPRKITRQQIRDGAWLVLFGLFKKMVVADNLSGIVETAFSAPSASPLAVLTGVYAFAFQIYGDFSGYSDIARGISKFMGFELMINFNLPYFALNPSDFWRRWHISLSTWLRDYLYIPLGGNRRSRVRTYYNLIMTMLLGGLWHGAAWTFVLWGLFHGVLLAAHRFLFGEARHDEVPSTLLGRTVRRIGMFHLVCVGWVLFRAKSLGQVWHMMVSLGGSWHVDRGTASDLVFMGLLVAPMLAIETLQHLMKDQSFILNASLVPRLACYSMLLLMLVYFANTGSHQFIYFQF